MLILPIENSANKILWFWKQVRPKVTQEFWKDFKKSNWKWAYKSFGLKWHNWIDFKAKVGIPILAPCDWVAKVKDSKWSWYWLHIKIRNPYKKLELVLGHLSSVKIKTWDKIYQWDIIWYSWNSSFSTGPHLHFWVRRIKIEKHDNIFSYPVKDYDNWYKWYYDIKPYLITYKWTLINTSLNHL